jgi:ubiquinone/menaquinone biosynthesis C-methylase UbiE
MSVSQEAGSEDAYLIPPKELLFDGSSSAEEFVLLGENFCNYILIPHARLDSSASILDLGCGNGQVARALTRVLSPAGRYEGIDVNPETIAWLQARYQRYSNFTFTHADVPNTWYNPGGRLSAGQYRFPFSNASFDVVLLKSVFTHMLPSDVRSYLREIGRVLKPGGRAVLTYFLLNDESRRFIARGLAQISFKFEYPGDALCRVVKEEVPEWAVAHDEQRIRQYHTEAGLSTLELSFGNWCGRRALLGLQDMIIAIKE